MAHGRPIPLTADVANGTIIAADLSGRELVSTDIRVAVPEWLIFRFSFLTTANAGQNWVPHTFAAGAAFKLGIKLPASITGASFTAYADGTDWNRTEDWALVDPRQGRCCVRFDTSGMVSAMTTAAVNAVTMAAEVEVIEPGEFPFKPARFDISAYNAVIQGNEGTPAPTTATYPTLAQFNAIIPPGFTVTRPSDTEISFCIDGVPVETIKLG